VALTEHREGRCRNAPHRPDARMSWRCREHCERQVGKVSGRETQFQNLSVALDESSRKGLAAKQDEHERSVSSHPAVHGRAPLQSADRNPERPTEARGAEEVLYERLGALLRSLWGCSVGRCHRSALTVCAAGLTHRSAPHRRRNRSLWPIRKILLAKSRGAIRRGTRAGSSCSQRGPRSASSRKMTASIESGMTHHPPGARTGSTSPAHPRPACSCIAFGRRFPRFTSFPPPTVRPWWRTGQAATPLHFCTCAGWYRKRPDLESRARGRWRHTSPMHRRLRRARHVGEDSARATAPEASAGDTVDARVQLRPQVRATSVESPRSAGGGAPALCSDRGGNRIG
ncbi:MAG: hypothetical protein JWR33_2587, partial [Naasia sp.]|nr:hypothetical protein [Naasia sp.]